ncbi:MAG: TIM barrel protein [Rhodothermales bacterium]|nr:TIM barrel protein [Rhodothermales bacterium]
MKRRDFVRTSFAAGALAAAGPLGPLARPEAARPSFTLRYAPHFGMFRHLAGDDPVAQLEFAAEQGFTAWEDNGMKGRPVEEQERIARTIARLGMQMGVFVAHTIYWQQPNLAGGDPDLRAEFLREIEESVEVAKRVNATWMTVVPGHLDLRLEPDYQTANVVETLRRAAEILEPHGLVMVLEPLNPFRDHPGLFLTKIPQAYLICRAVDSPACKILFDIYHQQITEGNLIPNIERAWDEIGYFQIGDNPGRNEPTTGEINYARVFEYIHRKGFRGVLGMEHGNAQPGSDGERAVIEAYRQVDPA